MPALCYERIRAAEYATAVALTEWIARTNRVEN